MFHAFHDISKMTALSLLKIKLFWNKGYHAITSFYNVTNKTLLFVSDSIVDVVKWQHMTKVCRSYIGKMTRGPSSSPQSLFWIGLKFWIALRIHALHYIFKEKRFNKIHWKYVVEYCKIFSLLIIHCLFCLINALQIIRKKKQGKFNWYFLIKH